MTSQQLHGKNRRSTNRYEMSSALWYRAAGSSGWKRGRTLDMSAGGMLIEIPEMMGVNTRLEIEMDWNGLFHGTGMLRLSVVGSVTRRDSRGIAVRILSHSFRMRNVQTAVA